MYKNKVELCGVNTSKLKTLTEEEKQAVPYVMQAIELLFAAWFLGEQDIKCAKDAIRIYDFVDRNTDRIKSLIQ